MRERTVSLPELILLAGTRVALGAGIGLLISGRIDRHARKGAGWALVVMGALTTVPLVAGIAKRSRQAEQLPPAAAA